MISFKFQQRVVYEIYFSEAIGIFRLIVNRSKQYAAVILSVPQFFIAVSV